MKRWLLIPLVVLLALIAGTAFAPAPPDYASLDANGDPLKTAFNQDVGKVRVIMLVAPT